MEVEINFDFRFKCFHTILNFQRSRAVTEDKNIKTKCVLWPGIILDLDRIFTFLWAPPH